VSSVYRGRTTATAVLLLSNLDKFVYIVEIDRRHPLPLLVGCSMWQAFPSPPRDGDRLAWRTSAVQRVANDLQWRKARRPDLNDPAVTILPDR
jgi:hypothetical protein